MYTCIEYSYKRSSILLDRLLLLSYPELFCEFEDIFRAENGEEEES